MLVQVSFLAANSRAWETKQYTYDAAMLLTRGSIVLVPAGLANDLMWAVVRSLGTSGYRGSVKSVVRKANPREAQTIDSLVARGIDHGP